MPKKILITGSTGFIGSNLVKRLLDNGNKIISVDNDFRGNSKRLNKFDGDLDIHSIDVRDKTKLIEVSRGCDYFFHLAYINGTDNFYSQPDNVLDVGVRGILNAFDCCIENKIKNLFIASSSEVLHEPDVIPTNEEAPIKIPDISNPRYSYAGGKILYELLGKHFAKKEIDRVIIFRPFNVYGPDMGMGHVIPQLINRIKENNFHIKAKNNELINFEIQGDGTQTRAFEHIDDFIDGIEILMKKGKDREIYNIGNDEEISINDLVNKIFTSIDKSSKVNLVHTKLPEGGTNRRCPDISKIKQLGYVPRILIDDGLPEVVQYYLK